MNSTMFVAGQHTRFIPKGIGFVIVHLLRSSSLKEGSSLRRVFLLSSDGPGPCDPAAVEQSDGPRTFQD